LRLAKAEFFNNLFLLDLPKLYAKEVNLSKENSWVIFHFMFDLYLGIISTTNLKFVNNFLFIDFRFVQRNK